ncbi:orotate phosphoribosyltransferase [Rubidibacter lacunae KORDI 51-2]|uniref:Orotate phosphoribosyltransferase n=1 Tax=Rubidibacter lacunae KORDI 51-2 TaxID=582515 RepID=U5DL96_9CHRO|nr:orotate phosphoribosyltransferase [Rubidibacter lacunae]ERN41637.1 orotate phosphoribosyltransferase [Rubidibacter lacunae KORDI 51-2]
MEPLPSVLPATIDLDSLRSYLLDLLVRRAFREGGADEFLLSSGQRSAYYIDCKRVSLMAEGAIAIARLFLELLPADTDSVAGLTLGADPLVTAVSVASGYGEPDRARFLPALVVRKEAKGHGTGAYIEGPDLAAGARVVVLEDVVTTGKSAMRAVERLRACGYDVDRVLAVVDREQGGAALYRESGLEFQALFSLTEICARARTLAQG